MNPILGFLKRHWRGLAILVLLGVVWRLAHVVGALDGKLKAQTDKLAQVLDAQNSCDRAIDLHGWNANCSSAVQRLAQQAGTDAQNLEQARGELKAATQTTTEAVARAESRCADQALRTARAQAARQGAPVGGAGLRVYDAERLRLRWQQP